MAANMPKKKKTLDEHIQALPQELQDEILDCTLAIKPGFVTINLDYKPPKQLCINRATREKFAKAFYNNCTFQLEEPRLSHDKVVTMWLRSMPKEHQSMVADIQYFWLEMEPGVCELYDEESECLDAQGEARDLNGIMQSYGIQLQETALKVHYFIVCHTCCGDSVVAECWASQKGHAYPDSW